MPKKKILFLTEIAVLIAIIIFLTVTRLGYLSLGPVLSITLMTIPVAIGAVALGPLAGTILGFAFGLTSFLQCYGADPFGAALLAASPLYTFIVCVPTRTLVGLFTGLIARATKKRPVLSCTVSSFACPLMNTALFLSTLFLLFWGHPLVAGSDVTQSVFALFITFAGVNAIAEVIATGVVGTLVSKALMSMNKNQFNT